MAESSKVFREKALVRLASPEELDKMIQVTDLKGWIALGGAAVILVAALIWGIFGSLPVTTQGSGLLVRQDGIKQIKSNLSGQLTALNFQAGDTVKEGQVLGKIKSDSGQESEIRSPYSGTVLEALVEKDSQLKPQDVLANLEQTDHPLQAVIFVPLAEGKRLHPNLKVQLAPTTVRTEEYGYLLGTVSSVSQFPVSNESLLLTLKSKELVESVAASGPVIRVDVNLETAPGSPSGFKWSSSSGPQLMLTGGTPASANLILAEQSPISLLLPFLQPKQEG
jgi:multidrug efflux pump subunit AcrA (membrane-fusion protein)